MNRLLFIVFAFILFAQPSFSQRENPLDYKYDYLKRIKHRFEYDIPNHEKRQAVQEDSAITLVGRWIAGACYSADMKDQYAYIGNGPKLDVYDIKDPSQPKRVFEYLLNIYADPIKVYKDRLYVVDGNDLLIFSLLDPSQPQLMSRTYCSGIIDMVMNDTMVYATIYSCKLRIIDVTDPYTPILRGWTWIAGFEVPAGIDIKDSIVYTSGYTLPGMSIVNVANPDTPIAQFWDINYVVPSLIVCDTTLYFVTFEGYFFIYSIRDLNNPILIDSTLLNEQPGNLYDMTAINDQLYLFNGDYGSKVYSINISDPYHPVFVDKYNLPPAFRFGDINYFNNQLIVSVDCGAAIINITNPDSLLLISYMPAAGALLNMKIINNYAYICSGHSGLWVLDISDPSEPKEMSNLAMLGWVEDLLIDSNYLYLICSPIFSTIDTGFDSTVGLYIIDVSDVYHPAVLSHYRGINKNLHNYIAKNKNFIFITQSDVYPNIQTDSILEVIDVSDPYYPQRASIFRGQFGPYDLEKNDSLVFIATKNQGGLKILNHNDPYNLNLISSFQYGSPSILGISIRDTFIYAHRCDTFFVLSFKDPNDIKIIGRSDKINNSGYYDIIQCIEGNYVYWAEKKIGIVNISNPINPIQYSFHMGDWVNHIAAKENNFYFPLYDKGLYIYRNNLTVSVNEPQNDVKKNFILYQNYPNPFNSNTTIELYLNRDSYIELDLFNILGQKVKTLLKNKISKGYFKTHIDMNNFASGVYLYRLKTEEGSVTKKMVFLR